MQGYSYSVFSILAIAIHSIINLELYTKRVSATVGGERYRRFLTSVLAYYIVDAAWGIFAGLEWIDALYVDTILYFMGIAVFVFTWSRFAVSYLKLGKWSSRILTSGGWAMLAVTATLLALNVFNNKFFWIDARGTYLMGPYRNVSFTLLTAFNILTSILVLAKAAKSHGASRGRNMMIFVNSLTITAAIVLQVAAPLTPFTALGCLIGTCFLHAFVVKDEQTEMQVRKLERALERAHAAEKARSMFFSIVSHDIRTPLNAILGYSELLRHGVKSQAERDEALDSIRASGTTLLQLVNDVLDLAKMDSGKMTLQPKPMNLSDLTDEVFASFRMVAGSKGIKLVNNTARVPPIVLDSHRIRQILFNLVGNAVKFTKSGSITVNGSHSDSTLTVSVTDTGCGIPADKLAHIFDPFVQVHDPTHSHDRAVGTGLGLTICRSLVEVMGGELTVESEFGKGTTFTMSIPGIASCAEAKVKMPEKAAKPAPQPTKHPEHVLVVDDSPVNRAVLTAFLKRAGVPSIEFASDGIDALAKLNSAVRDGTPYDFVLSDFWMPNMNGLEFIEKLRADSRFSRIPAFAVTADTEFHNDARASLFNGVLLKPITYAKLLETFANL